MVVSTKVVLVLFFVLNLAFGDDTFTIILDSDENSTGHDFNHLFITKCSDFYDILVRGNNTIDQCLQTNKLTSKTLPQCIFSNIINLNFKHVNKYYAIGEQEMIVHAGDTQTNSEYKYENSKMESNCSIKLMTNAAAKVNSGDLLDFVSSIRIENENIYSRQQCMGYTKKNTDLKTVLVCLPDDTSNCYGTWRHKNNLNVKMSKNCDNDVKKYSNNLLAVLAPTPNVIKDYLIVPIIFYKTPYLNEEYLTAFPNAASNYPWWLMKYGFVGVLNSMNWIRVAIISDDTPYSTEFEKHLIDVFRTQNVMYTVKRCDGKRSDFDKALKSLQKAKTVIVIANIDEENSKKLKKFHENTFIWLTRDFILPRPQKPSFSLILTRTEGNQKCDGINEGLKSIMNAYKKTKMNRNILYKANKLDRQAYYRYFSDSLKKHFKSSATIKITKVYNNSAKLLLASHDIDDINHSISFKHLPFPFNRPDDVVGCMVRSNNYFRPCDDYYIIYIMVVIALFCVFFLLIFCVFDRTSIINTFMNKYSRMQ